MGTPYLAESQDAGPARPRERGNAVSVLDPARAAAPQGIVGRAAARWQRDGGHAAVVSVLLAAAAPVSSSAAVAWGNRAGLASKLSYTGKGPASNMGIEQN